MRLRKKSQNLNRSDSTGSSSGRKFLAPTLSDPQTLRTDKYSQKKKSNTFINTNNSGNASVMTPTGTKPRNQILQTDHTTRSRSQNILRPELTTESEEYEDIAASTSSVAPTIGKNTFSSIHGDNTFGLHVSHHVSQSMHGFDLQSNAQLDTTSRISTLNNINNNNYNNNNSSSTGSNIAASSSKINANAFGGNSGNTNVVYEVHDWWTDQVNAQSSEEEDDE